MSRHDRLVDPISHFWKRLHSLQGSWKRKPNTLAEQHLYSVLRSLSRPFSMDIGDWAFINRSFERYLEKAYGLHPIDERTRNNISFEKVFRKEWDRLCTKAKGSKLSKIQVKNYTFYLRLDPRLSVYPVYDVNMNPVFISWEGPQSLAWIWTSLQYKRDEASIQRYYEKEMEDLQKKYLEHCSVKWQTIVDLESSR